MNPTVFLGLVTHRRSRFAHSASSEGMLSRLGRSLADRGVEAHVAIHDEDRYDPSLVDLTQESVRRSIHAELTLEQRWRSYVDPSVNVVALAAQMAARRAYRIARLAPPWHRSAAATEPGSAMLRRLVNIELAHLHLLREARARGVSWALIAEDDAYLEDVDAFSAAMVSFMQARDQDSQPAYVNVSRSFGHEAIGLTGRLATVGSWSPGIDEKASDRPLTNTVCAVLYRGTFLRTLVPAMDAIPTSPVLPIDWKLNATLLALHDAGSLGPGDCWFLDPAPIVQGSMHGSAD